MFSMEIVFNCHLGLRWRLLYFILSETGSLEASKVSRQTKRKDRASAAARNKTRYIECIG